MALRVTGYLPLTHWGNSRWGDDQKRGWRGCTASPFFFSPYNSLMSDDDNDRLGRGLNAGHMLTGLVLLAMVAFVLMWLV